MRSFLAQRFGLRSHERSTFSKRVGFHKNGRQELTKNNQNLSETAPCGSVWVDIWSKSIPRHPGSFLKTSRALGRLFLTRYDQNGPKTGKTNPYTFPL